MDLQTQINELNRKFESLRSSSTFPKEIEDAIRDRIKPFTSFGGVGTQANTVFTSFNVTVPNVTGYIIVNIGGSNYKLLYQ